jgi:hypothetical protein
MDAPLITAPDDAALDTDSSISMDADASEAGAPDA